MKNIIKVLPLVWVLSFWSCNEKIQYGTALAIENQMSDSVFVFLYPKSTSYSGMIHYEMKPTQDENFYWEPEQNNTPAYILTNEYDSVVLKINSDSVVFSLENVVGYKYNPFTSNELWESKIRSYDTPDNFNRNPHEDVVYTLILKDSLRQLY